MRDMYSSSIYVYIHVHKLHNCEMHDCTIYLYISDTAHYESTVYVYKM